MRRARYLLFRRIFFGATPADAPARVCADFAHRCVRGQGQAHVSPKDAEARHRHRTRAV